MQQGFTSVQNVTNEHGVPTGGGVLGEGLSIAWQAGPLENAGTELQRSNGAFVEDVIEAARQRLAFFQEHEAFRCRENALAITKLEEALHWLQARTDRRGAEGKLGTHES